MKTKLTYLAAIVATLTSFGLSYADEYDHPRNREVKQVAQNLIGTWEGSFRHLYLPAEVKVAVAINEILFQEPVWRSHPDPSGWSHDEWRQSVWTVAVTGTVTLNDELFKITSIDLDRTDSILFLTNGRIRIRFENGDKESMLELSPGMLLRSYPRTKLGTESFGILVKQN